MLSYMMEDSNSSVIKRVMTAFMQLYMIAFIVSTLSHMRFVYSYACIYVHSNIGVREKFVHWS